MSVATQVNHHCPFYGRKCYQCGYWNRRGNECEIITHQDRKIWCLTPSGIKYNSMLISEFIQQLQDVYDEEGDMEIAIKIDDNDLGSEPIVVKSTVYEQFYITNS